MSKLCLIDASGYIHRAYHAIPPLTNSKGEPVNAVYGFSRMVSKILKEEKPDFLGVCFDTAAPTFRHEAYVDYKATRVDLDMALISQLPWAEELAVAWGLPCIKKDGFEADDVIATLAKWGKKAKAEVLILSGDKDILQLVDKDVFVRDEIKKVTYDEEKVKERYGLTPKQLVDYLSLTGDKVDNVVGIPGVGEKTATKLMAAHGSLEGIYAGINGNLASMKEKLLNYKDTVFRNRSLITLNDDVPLDITLEDLKVKKPDTQALAPILARLEFKAGLYGVDDQDANPAGTVNIKRKVTSVLNEQDLHLLQESLRSCQELSIATEHDVYSKGPSGLVGIGLCSKENQAWYIPIQRTDDPLGEYLAWKRVQDAIKPFWENPQIKKVGHNLKLENALLEKLGISMKGPSFDTMVAAYCLDPSRSKYNWAELALELFDERVTRHEDLVGKGKAESFSHVALKDAAIYAGTRAGVVLQMMGEMEKRLKKENVEDLFLKLEMPLIRIIQQMEEMGIAIDVDYLKKIGKKFTESRNKLEKEIFDLAGETFVLNSPKQLAHILFEKLKLPPSRKTKTGYSTDEEVLLKLAADHPICEKIIACRELNKLISTYVDSLLNSVNTNTGRIHTTFHQTGTITGRLSSSNPNLQNIPIRTENGREIRRAFVASKGCVLLSADYSQIDLRVLAHISGDPVLIKSFQAGGDIHAVTAAEIFHVPLQDVTSEMRQSAKAINFGIVYGQQAFALSQALNVSMETARDFIRRYFERYAGVRGWIESTLVKARKEGVVVTLAGRKRNVSDVNSSNSFARGFAERVAVNTPIQGSSADIIKAAMIVLADQLDKKQLKTRMLVQVHDELLFETPKEELNTALAIIRQGMEQAFPLQVPLVVDVKVGSNWNDMEKLKLEKVA